MKKEPDAETANVTVVCRSTSTPFIRNVVKPFRSNVYLLWGLV